MKYTQHAFTLGACQVFSAVASGAVSCHHHRAPSGFPVSPNSDFVPINRPRPAPGSRCWLLAPALTLTTQTPRASRVYSLRPFVTNVLPLAECMRGSWRGHVWALPAFEKLSPVPWRVSTPFRLATRLWADTRAAPAFRLPRTCAYRCPREPLLSVPLHTRPELGCWTVW